MSDPSLNDLLYVGITHQSAPLAIRELLRTDQNICQELVSLCRGQNASNLLVLSTCERFEIYVLSTQKSFLVWLSYIARIFSLTPTQLAPYMTSYVGKQAARHLLRVAAGMESRIVGEPHILGQLRQAFDQAKEAHVIRPTLSALFRSAIHTGKRIRNETDINRRRQSIVTLTIQDMRRTLPGLQNKRLAIVGTGTLAAGLILALQGVSNQITVVSDQTDRAHALANLVGAATWTRHEFLSQLSTLDAIVMCTTCSAYVLHHDDLNKTMAGELFIWDLSYPGAVDPRVGNVHGLKLTRLDDLVRQNPASQYSFKACDEIINQELSRLINWSIHRKAAPKISRLIKRMHNQSKQPGRVTDTHRLHCQIMRLKQEAAA